jgi:hypothetical protein
MLHLIRRGFQARLTEIGFATYDALPPEERAGLGEGAEAASHLTAPRGRDLRPDFFVPTTIDLLREGTGCTGQQDLVRHLAGDPDAVRSVLALGRTWSPYPTDPRIAEAGDAPDAPALMLGEALANAALGLDDNPSLAPVGFASFTGSPLARDWGFTAHVGEAMATYGLLVGVDPIALLVRLGYPSDVAEAVFRADLMDARDSSCPDLLEGSATLVVSAVERRIGGTIQGWRDRDEGETRAAYLVGALAQADFEAPATLRCLEILRDEECLARPVMSLLRQG